MRGWDIREKEGEGGAERKEGRQGREGRKDRGEEGQRGEEGRAQTCTHACPQGVGTETAEGRAPLTHKDHRLPPIVTAALHSAGVPACGPQPRVISSGPGDPDHQLMLEHPLPGQQTCHPAESPLKAPVLTQGTSRKQGQMQVHSRISQAPSLRPCGRLEANNPHMEAKPRFLSTDPAKNSHSLKKEDE